MEDEYALFCASVHDDDLEKIIQAYPVLKNYKTRTEYPYVNKSCPRNMIVVQNIRKFCEEIETDIIVGRDESDRDTWSLTIYDSYIE